MEFKSFDRALFQANDRRAREAVKKHLGSECVDNEDIYGPDLCFDGGFVEVEVCKGWKGGKFPYPVAHVPGRKGKWRHLKIEYWLLSNDLSKAIITQGNKLDPKFLQEVPNKYMKQGELFYRMPLDMVTEIELEGSNDGQHSELCTGTTKTTAKRDPFAD